LADGLYGGLIPTPPAEYAKVWRFPTPPTVPAKALVNHDLRDYHGQSLFAPVADQGQIGSCAAFAFAYYLRAALAAKYHVDNGSAPDLPDTLAPRFLYDETRRRMGTYPDDSGSDMKTAASVLLDLGCAPERDMPYTGQADNGPLDAEFTAHVTEAAAFYGVSGYYRLGGTGDALLDAIEACLHQAQPVAIAVLVPQSFMRTSANGRVPNPSPDEQILGGHALCVGLNFYDNSFSGGRCIGGPNSWTRGWGQDGYFLLPASYAHTRHRQYGAYLAEAWTVV
jgi:C1A family cysteine protease